MSVCLLCFVVLSAIPASPCRAQDDFYPIPQRQGNFGFPYPPPTPDEPGVTFSKRYLLDGEPHFRFRPRPQDEVWLVSTRGIPTGEVHEEAYQQLICKHPVGTAWNQVPIDQLFDVNQRHPDLPTVIFIHGNRTPAFWSRRRGKHAYQALVGNRTDMPSLFSPDQELPPTRFIIWSWPSDPLDRPLQDFADKSTRSRTDGAVLGQFLKRLGSSQLVIVAYSLGTQIALDSLQSMAMHGGQPRAKLVSMAPVTRCDWPQRAEQIPLVVSQLDQFCLFQNEKDIALKAFKAFCAVNGRPPCPLAIDTLASQHHSVKKYDVSRQIGREHNIINYLSVPQVRHEVNQAMVGR